MQRYLAGQQDAGDELINSVGIRAAESDSRSKMPEWEWQDGFDCEVWRPLIHRSEQWVIDIHKRHGLAPNPLYLMGASRVGCWPCIYARKSEIRLIAQKDPGRIVRLRVLEGDVRVAAKLRWDQRELDIRSARHEWASLSLDEKINQRGAGVGPLPGQRPFHPPAWFQNPSARTPDDNGLCWPIDKVVTWSKTIRGGSEEDRQENLFASMNDGCMRWGLCDTGTSK